MNISQPNLQLPHSSPYLQPSLQVTATSNDQQVQHQPQELLSQALNKIHQLEDEIECLTGVISVMKEDLQVIYL